MVQASGLKVFPFIVLCEDLVEVRHICQLLRENGLISFCAVVSTMREVQLFWVPNMEQTAILTSTPGNYGSVFERGANLKTSCPGITTAWLDHDAYGRQPSIDIGISAGTWGGGKDFEYLCEFLESKLGFAPFQRLVG